MKDVIKLEIPEIVYKGVNPYGTSATENDVVLGKTFYSNGKDLKTGKLDLNKYEIKLPTQEKEVNPETILQEIVADDGYKLSKVIVNAVEPSIDDNIQPYNIRKGITILGVNGNLEPDKPDQIKTITPNESEQKVMGDEGYELAEVTVEAIPKNYVGSAIPRKLGETIEPVQSTQVAVSGGTYVEEDVIVDAIKVETREVKSNSTTQIITPTEGKYINEVIVDPIIINTLEITPTTAEQLIIKPDNIDGYNNITIKAVTNNIDANILPENIKKDVTILGVIGTFEGGEREQHETMKEMQEADYMRYVQGTIGLYDIPTDAEYLEQEQYVNTTINNLMGEEF